MSILERKVKEILDKENKTMSWLAKSIGYSRQGLKNGLSNKTIKYATLEKIAQVLGYDTFFGFVPKPADKGGPHYADTFMDSTDIVVALVLCNRYSKFSDRLACIKDYFIWDIIDTIYLGYIPNFENPDSGKKEPLLTNKEFIQLRKIITPERKKKPFSKWDKEAADIIYSTPILKEFYFIIFNRNHMNIVQYIEDGMITDREIIKYWNLYKETARKNHTP